MFFSKLTDWKLVVCFVFLLCLVAATQLLAAEEQEVIVEEKPAAVPAMKVTAVFTLKVSCENEACEVEGCDGTKCECESSDEVVTEKVIEEISSETNDTADATVNLTDDTGKVPASHQQTDIIKVHVDGLSKDALKTFCVTTEGEILAACASSDSGDVRRFSATGEFLDSFEVPYAPEAINFGSDGRVYVAGAGKISRYTLEGELVNEGVHPNSEVSEERRAEIREEVIASHKQQSEWMSEYVTEMDQQIETIEKKLGITHEEEESTETIEETADDEAASDTADEELEEAAAEEESPADKLRNQRNQMMLDSLTQQREMYQRMLKQQGEEELTEEQIKQQVQSSIAYKIQVASISESDGEVFLATGATEGYGFAVWRMNRQFEGGEQIADQLSGCCGQMDVQAREGRVYVAENSRHKVRCFDRKGEAICEWGSGAREGIKGFGSCCNPMNVAFGPGESVYTAESGTGRIKLYSPDGQLLGLVGKAELVPGCKKVSIAVGPGGDRVYMLDITRNHILLLERLGEGEQVSYYESKEATGNNNYSNGILVINEPFTSTPNDEKMPSDTFSKVFYSIGKALGNQ